VSFGFEVRIETDIDNMANFETTTLGGSKRVMQDPPYAAMLRQAVQSHRAGRLQEAERLYRQVLAENPQQPDAHHNLGAVLARHGRLTEALPHLKAGVEGRPEESKYWSACIQVMQALGAREDLAELYRKLTTLQPGLAAAHYNLANALKDLGRWDEAADSYRTALKLNPGLAAAHNNLGNVSKLQGKLDDADAGYRAAIAADPDFAEAHCNLGNVLEQRGHLDAAEACYRRVLALTPDHIEVNRHLGAVLMEQGRTADGLDAFMRYAQRKYGGGTPPAPTSASSHKSKHDAEQRAWLGNENISTDTFRLEGGARVGGGAINRDNDAAAICTAWRVNKPQIVVIDNLLTQEALTALRRMCHGSTFWRNSFPNGYLGAVPQDGFAAPLLAQISEELAAVYSEIFEGHPLLQLWAFKYDSSLKGINLHADFAAVNVNFWITPESANRDPDHGGLIIWDKAAPLDWDFAKYNNDEAAMRNFLRTAGAQAITVPYRANRAVIFDSDLFHETDQIQFREGYENRRVNVTFLYGWRASGRGNRA
jgi:tetratricopeptide (TPR) repeat protein